ncbi:hypothetical protein QJS10_CPA06g00916 [Acorus calamus]|uniref:IST1-like protein n=1 Tax=Acorus calamus TaxID=4465 RepID=A0AAV9EKE3_ACOCL|nr:hypothetical protein QJS10_CPA06g00916 [Acorus calamus]
MKRSSIKEKMHLKKSFDSGKCKTSLKLALARIKLLKNKRDAQVKVMRRDLAQLLETNQKQTALIRVEHVVREEKTMAAYDLIQLYCEQIVTRLPIIESQKNCPIDLKEAITSVIFASPRCADLTELHDICKHFQNKYGKEFITAAVELRPDCGVNHLVVEKLSARAPDGEMKIKILTAVAQEHNVKWNPEDFQEALKPHKDLLNGHTTFAGSSMKSTDSSKMHFQPPHSHKPEPATKQAGNDSTRSSDSFKSPSTVNNTTRSVAVPTSSQSDPRTSESNLKPGDYEQSFSDEEDEPSTQHKWNMDFKDATSAAQAAAESAERASLAARAAAELASRENSYSPRAGPKNSARINSQGGHASEVSRKTDTASAKRYSGEKSRMQNQQKEEIHDNFSAGSESVYDDGGSFRSRSNRSVASQHNRTSFDGETSNVNFQKSHQSTRTNDIGSGEGDLERPASSQFGRGSSVGDSTFDKYLWKDEIDEDNGAELGRQESGKHVGRQPSLSDHSGAEFDGSGSEGDDHLDFNIFNREHESTMHISPRHSPKIDPWSPRQQRSDSFSMESFNHPSKADPWSPKQHRESFEKDNDGARSHFDADTDPFTMDAQTTVASQSADVMPIYFDHSDAESSQNEEIEHYSFGEEIQSSISQQKEDMFFESSKSTRISQRSNESSVSTERKAGSESRKPAFHAVSDDSDSDDSEPEYRQRTQQSFFDKSWRPHDESSPKEKLPYLNATERGSFGVKNTENCSPPTSRLSGREESLSRDSINDDQLNESGPGLNLGRLTGGFRHKRLPLPPYVTGSSLKDDLKDDPLDDPLTEQLDDASVATKPLRDTTVTEKPTISYTEKMSVASADHKREPYHQKKQSKVSSRNPMPYFDLDDDEIKDVRPYENVGGSVYKGSRLSRRTRDLPNQSETRNPSKITERSDSTDISSDIRRYKPSQSSSSNVESQSKLPAKASRGSKDYLKPMQHKSASQQRSEAELPPKPPLSNVRKSSLTSESSVESLAQSNSLQQRSAAEPPPKPLSRNARETSLTNEGSKSLPQDRMSASEGGSNSSQKLDAQQKGSSSIDASQKSHSHVHPKLPDYETFAAYFASLRSNRRSS